MLVASKAAAGYFEEAAAAARDVEPKLVANWLANDLLGRLSERGEDLETTRVTPQELGERVALAYTNASRNSGINNWEVTKRHIDGDASVQKSFARIRDIAAAMRNALERRDWAEVGRQIAAEWDNRKRLAPGVTTPEIDAMMAAACAAGASAGKVCGAGGGGCLFCFGDPDKIPAVRGALARAGARVLDFRIEERGLEIVRK